MQPIRIFAWSVRLVLLAGIALGTMGPAAAQMGGGGGMGTTITAAYVDGAIPLDPADPAWDQASEATVSLTRFIDFVADDGMGGMGGDGGMMGCMEMGMSIDQDLYVKAVHNGSEIAFRFQWNDTTADTVVEEPNLFGDALAMEIPYSGTGDTSLAMGSQDEPVNIMFWRADLGQPQNIVAGGIETPQPSPDAQNFEHSQDWSSGVWTVVVRRPMSTATDNQIDLSPGSQYNIAFANWDGSDKNRNGKKAFGNWNTLSVE